MVITFTGEGSGDDEQIKIDLTKMTFCKGITVVVTIHDADTRRQNFGQVEILSSEFSIQIRMKRS